MICTNYSKEFSDYLEKCPYCGQDANSTDKTIVCDESESIHKVRTFITGLNIICGVICLFAFFNEMSYDEMNVTLLVASISLIVSGVIFNILLNGFAKLLDNSEKIIAIQKEQLKLLSNR